MKPIRMLALLACALLLTAPAICEEEVTMYTVTPNWDNVKPLGRTRPLEDSLWLAFSGTGAEFTFHGARCEVAIAGDSNAARTNDEGNKVRIAIYVDGERVVDDLIDAKEKTYTVLDAPEARDAVVRIVKLSETAMSTCGIRSVSVDDPAGIRPTAAKNRRIEFIGDSITCGYGVDDEVPENHFVTGTEDVTRAYAYRTAEMLDADYSMVSISGYGIISGYTATGEAKVTAQLIPTYYGKLGFSYGTYQRRIVAAQTWDFSAWVPDLIVINLGTNDDSYTLNEPARQEEYRAAYVDFLKAVRRNNPDAKLLCTLGIMGDRLYPMVAQAAADYAAETGDMNIATMRFDVQLASDGYVADWHPTAVTHEKAATKLAETIRALMGW
ncbi:MAG: GDSL-type esterase/lipase family protein [Aristaeellaceae bacterium]